MKNKNWYLIVLILLTQLALNAATIRGKVFVNKEVGTDMSLENLLTLTLDEPIIGAAIVIRATGMADFSGLDGSYKLNKVPVGSHEITISYPNYVTKTVTVDIKSEDEVVNIDFYLSEETVTLGEIVISYVSNKEIESFARTEEKEASTVSNVVSAKTIEQSPDITVANVVQRVSGLTIERNSNGDGQYAIVRGMDKRYNYTLVNGIKIPSPDNENRYVPLDIFPSDLLSRLVVTKSLTPDMEGDAIGGVVDMKMKDAPMTKLINASLATGYSELLTQRPFDYYNPKSISKISPREREGRIVTAPDFSSENFNYEKINPMPNVFGSVSLGNRFYNKKLGVIVSGSYQNQYRGSDREEFRVSSLNRSQTIPEVTVYQKRTYSNQQERAGVHNKIDYIINEKNKLSLYNAYLRLQNNETRLNWIDELRGGQNPTLEYQLRAQTNIQQIYNSTLQGNHDLSAKLKADWSLVYSLATQQLPDNSILRLVANYDGGIQRWIIDDNFERIWEKNSDRDYAAYYNFIYTPKIGNQEFEFKYGGLYRIKDRNNQYDSYTFKPNPGVQAFEPFESDFANLTWRTTNGAGTPTHVLNYTSFENIFANYLQFKFIRWKTQFIVGLRTEHTNQGYETENNTFPEGGQKYWSILPSLHIKHMPNPKTNIRTSYFKSLSRPSFLEIIPYRRPSQEEIFARAGNPELIAVTAHNFDVRYEYFATATDQLLIGAFYKIIQNPIEYAVIPPGIYPNPPTTTFMPLNFSTAVNRGIEMDYTKYIKNFGIRLNYTFTLSKIESIKRTWGVITADNIGDLSDSQTDLGIGDSTFINVIQERPLQGQSMHIGNLSLLYKNKKQGINGQLAMVYTGERIAVVAPGLNDDFWQKAFTQLDFSFEKAFGKEQRFVAFVKINNILDTPFELYVKKPHASTPQVDAVQPKVDNQTLVRRDIYGRTYMLGLRFKF
jgi:hypothetical protein